MAKLRRTSTGAYKARKALPDDIREAYAQTDGQRHEAIFWIPSDSASQAPSRGVLVEIEGRVSSLRLGTPAHVPLAVGGES